MYNGPWKQVGYTANKRSTHYINHEFLKYQGNYWTRYSYRATVGTIKDIIYLRIQLKTYIHSLNNLFIIIIIPVYVVHGVVIKPGDGEIPRLKRNISVSYCYIVCRELSPGEPRKFIVEPLVVLFGLSIANYLSCGERQ